MHAVKSVLTAIDFSGDARLAARRAALLAAEQQAKLELMHVMSGRSLNALRELFRSSDTETDLMKNARHMLNELAADIAGQTGVTASSRVTVGNVLDEILSASEQADMLILGAHGWNPLRDRILGTTAERLLGKCKRPVLVTKRPPQGAYKRVLVPVDFSPYSAAALRMALLVAPGAAFRVVHAFHVPFERMLMGVGLAAEVIQTYRNQARHHAVFSTDALIKESNGDPHRFTRAIEHGKASPLILAEEAGFGADLIIIGKHGRSVLEEMLLGSVTRHVLSNSKCDVLVVHEEKQFATAGA
jgi:nucleotide-binding universal stress UspA family protein